MRPSGATIAKWIIAGSAMVPALWVNTEHSWSLGWGPFLAAGGMIIGAAAFAEASKHAEGWGWSIGYALCALVLLMINVNTAVQSATNASDHRSDHRMGQISSAKSGQSQISEWSQRRAAQALVAGEGTPAKLAADVEKLKAADANRWRVTEECKPELIKGKPTRDFCAAVAEAVGKVEAAKKRDALDTKIEELRGKLDDKPPPKSADPYVDGVVALLAMRGVEVDEAGRSAIGATRSWLGAIGLEILAALGPAAVLTIMTPRARRRRDPATDAHETNFATKAEPATAPIAPPAAPVDDPIHVFVATKLERSEGDVMPAGSVWALWREHCVEHGIEPGSQKKFGGTLKAWFAWESNNNRPRYLNVRAKAPRLVVNN